MINKGSFESALESIGNVVMTYDGVEIRQLKVIGRALFSNRCSYSQPPWGLRKEAPFVSAQDTRKQAIIHEVETRQDTLGKVGEEHRGNEAPGVDRHHRARAYSPKAEVV